MPSKNTTTVVLSEIAQEVKDDLAPVFGLKNILSAGLLLFSRLNAEQQKTIISEALGKHSSIAEDARSIVASADASARALSKGKKQYRRPSKSG